MKNSSRKPIARYLSANECAQYLGIGRSTFLSWVKQGKVSSGVLLSARARRWSEEELLEFIAKRKQSTPPLAADF